MDSHIHMNVDAILIALGKYGRFQILQFAYILLCTLPETYPVLISAFIGHAPPFQCRDLTEPFSKYVNLNSNINDLEVTYGSCDVTIHNASVDAKDSVLSTFKCPDGYTFDVKGDETIISEWDLVCDRQGLGETSTMCVLIGQMLGAAIFTPLADRFGRLPVAVISHILMFLSNIGIAFIPSFSGFFVLRLIVGAFQQGLGLAHATIAVELFPRQTRGKIMFVASIAWAGCVMTLSVFAYLLREVSWRYLQLLEAYSRSKVIQRESLRWLVVNKKLKEVKKWIRTAAKMNRKDPDEIIRKVLPNMVEKFNTETLELTISNENENIERMNIDHSDERNVQNQQQVSTWKVTADSSEGNEKLACLDIFKRKILLRYSLILWFAWITDGMTYYGLFLTAHTLPGNRYLNFALSCIAEIPGTIIFYFIVDRWGRKMTTILLHAIAGVSLITSVSLLTIKDNSAASTASVVFNFLEKIGISGSFSVVYLLTPELYPTNLRNVGLGAASAAARIGGMVSPYAAMLATSVIWGPGVIFGSACIVVSFLSLFLPETMGRELPQSVAEMKSWRYTKPQKNTTKR